MSENTIKEIAITAINAFESNEDGSFEVFEKNAKLMYNSIANYPNILNDFDNPYLIGIVYSYLEGGLRDDENIAHVSFENACYCFAKVMNNEANYEKQCSALRLFLLMWENGSGASALCHEVFKKNCQELTGASYDNFKSTRSNLDLIKQTKSCILQIKSYCYSIFTKEPFHSSISSSQMARAKQYIQYDNHEEKPFTHEIQSNKHFFDLFYSYLESQINTQTTPRVTQI